MSWDGPQEDCRRYGWSNFSIRSRCRNCGLDLRAVEEAKRNRGVTMPPAAAPDRSDRVVTVRPPQI